MPRVQWDRKAKQPAKTMSDTPRTDEREARSEGPHDEWACTLCRQLERELNAAKQNQWVNSIHSCHNECARPMCVLRRERDEARKDVHDLMEQYQDSLQYGDEFVDCALIEGICDRLSEWDTDQPKP